MDSRGNFFFFFFFLTQPQRIKSIIKKFKPLLKMFSTSVPMSIYGISNYLKTYGSPPCCESLGGILTEKINFDIETSDYLLQYKVDTTLPTPTILKFPPKVSIIFLIIIQNFFLILKFNDSKIEISIWCINNYWSTNYDCKTTSIWRRNRSLSW